MVRLVYSPFLLAGYLSTPSNASDTVASISTSLKTFMKSIARVKAGVGKSAPDIPAPPPPLTPLEKAVWRYLEYTGEAWGSASSSIECGHPFVTLTDTKANLEALVGEARARRLIGETAHAFLVNPDGICVVGVDTFPTGELINEVIVQLEKCRDDHVDIFGDRAAAYRFLFGKERGRLGRIRVALFHLLEDRTCIEDDDAVVQAHMEAVEGIKADPFNPFVTLPNMEQLLPLFDDSVDETLNAIANKACAMNDKLIKELISHCCDRAGSAYGRWDPLCVLTRSRRIADRIRENEDDWGQYATLSHINLLIFLFGSTHAFHLVDLARGAPPTSA